jgi:hypothetical protein
MKKEVGTQTQTETHTFGFDEKFTSFGARNVKFFNGERFVGFPINSSTHVRW